MLNWLKSRFAGPSLRDLRSARAFPPDQPTITESGIRVENGARHIDASAEEQPLRLFEVENPAVEQCLLTYRAELKAEALRRAVPFWKCGAACQVAGSSSRKAMSRRCRARSTGLVTRSPST